MAPTSPHGGREGDGGLIFGLFRRPDPEPPRNVRLVCPDGDVIPVDLVHVRRHRKIDYWGTPYFIQYRHGMQMIYDYLPDRCWFQIWLSAPDEDDEYAWEDV